MPEVAEEVLERGDADLVSWRAHVGRQRVYE